MSNETKQQYVHMEFFEEFEKDLLNQGEGEEVAPGEEELEEGEEEEEEETEEEAEGDDAGFDPETNGEF